MLNATEPGAVPSKLNVTASPGGNSRPLLGDTVLMPTRALAALPLLAWNSIVLTLPKALLALLIWPDTVTVSESNLIPEVHSNQ